MKTIDAQIPFIIRHRLMGTCHLFREAEKAAQFMWGKDFDDYSIYVLVDSPETEINALRQQLIKVCCGQES